MAFIAIQSKNTVFKIDFKCVAAHQFFKHHIINKLNLHLRVG